VEICEDDPDFTIMMKAEKNCATYVSHVAKGPSGEASCDVPIGIPDENDFQKLIKHFCRKSCGLCGTEDSEEGVDDAVIKAKVNEIKDEIEEKELEEKIEKEMEEQKMEEQVEKEIEKEMEDQEKELAQTEENNHSAEDSETRPKEDEQESEKVTAGEEIEQSDAAVDEKRPHSTASVDKKKGKPAQEEDDHSADDTGKENKLDEQSAVSVDEKEQQSTASVDEGGQQSTASADEEGGSDEEAAAKVDNDSDSKNDSKANKESTTNGKQQVFTGGTFTLQRLQDTRKAVKNLINKLEQYYNGKDQSKRMMLDAWLSPWNFDNPNGTALKRGNKLIDTMARALVTDDQSEFMIGTIGSSVAAGHDNCHYDSYESQLERTFGPVWEAAGMKLVCQNAGEGGGCGDDHKNQVYCIKQNVSPKVDIAHYTWTYFESPAHVDNEKLIARESLIRWTQMLPHQPPVHAFNTQFLPGHDEKGEFELSEHYAKYGYNAFYLKSGHANGGYDYETDSKNEIDHYAWGFVGDGYHNVTRYGINEANADRKESLGVVFRNWHPGPLAFEFLSDAFAYVYSKAMLVALNLVEEHMTMGQDPREIWASSKRKILLKKSLPEPKFCEPRYCVVDDAPGCLNYEKPTYGNWGARVEGPDDNLNPHKGEIQNWMVWHEESDFWTGVGKQDTAIFQDRDDKEICRHLDQCGGISATSPDNGMVVFRLPKMEVGLVAICGCCGKDIGEEMFLQNQHIEIKYNGVVLNRTKWDIFPTGKCVRLLEKFPTEGAATMTPTGHAYLSIKALEGLWKPVRISHVITL